MPAHWLVFFLPHEKKNEPELTLERFGFILIIHEGCVWFLDLSVINKSPSVATSVWHIYCELEASQ